MKKIFTLFSFILLLTTVVQAQGVVASRVTTLQPELYDVTGQAFLEELSDGSVQLRLSSDFSTPFGPDVRVLLGNQLSLSGTQELTNLTTINHFDGALTVDVPSSIDINDFDNVLFYCVQFGLFWASGELAPPVGTALPVELSGFSATANKNDITLDWTTASESNNEGFVVERSADGKTFVQVSFLAADEANSSRKKEYHYIDTDVQQNLAYYYRLKQLDRDGRIDYSDIVIATIEGNSTTAISNIYPNPVTADGVAQFDITIEKETNNASYSINNQNGSQVLSSSLQLNTGLNNVKLDAAGLPKGLYFVNIQVDTKQYFKKLIL